MPGVYDNVVFPISVDISPQDIQRRPDITNFQVPGPAPVQFGSWAGSPTTSGGVEMSTRIKSDPEPPVEPNQAQLSIFQRAPSTAVVDYDGSALITRRAEDNCGGM